MIKILWMIFKITPVIFKYNASVTSWIRSPGRNKRVGGHPKSKHMLGLGFDIVPDDAADYQAMYKDFKEMGFTPVLEGNHLHLQY